jgi:DNA repair exonuclease SbcCD nuclease subunit
LHSFAHLSDIHIGAFRQPALQNLVLEAFDAALDICVEKGVDFVIVSGDLFDSNIPDMGLVNSAVRKIREVKDKGIQFYVVYGSHDFSPTQTSIVDILESAGLFRKVTEGKESDGKLELEFQIDDRTKTKLCGISGRRLGIERRYFEILDRETLEREEGFKIFIFHGAVTEYKPGQSFEGQSIPLSSLPKGFAYYAGGHIHEEFLTREHGYYIAYPGTLFASDYRDLEKNARGQKRGFFIATFSDKLQHVEFVELPVCDYELIEYDASGKNSARVHNELLEIVNEAKPSGKIVLLRVWGEMSGGKTSDVDFQHLKTVLRVNGALEVLPNYQKLTSKEYSQIKVSGEDIRGIEDRLFRENIGTVKVSNLKLKGESGVKLSRELLSVLREGRNENEPKNVYEPRITQQAIEVLGLKEALG